MRRAETILKSQEESGVSQNDHPVVVLSFFAHAHTRKRHSAKNSSSSYFEQPSVNPWTKQ